MRPIDADFGPRSHRRHVALWLASAGLLVAAQLFLLDAWRLAAERERLMAARAAAETAAQAAPDMPTAEVPPPYTRDAERWWHLSSMDLSGTFASIESARIAGVRVTSVDFRAAEGWARVELASDRMELLLRYLDAINAGQPADDRWTLLRTQAGVTAGGQAVATLTRRLRTHVDSKP